MKCEGALPIAHCGLQHHGYPSQSGVPEPQILLSELTLGSPGRIRAPLGIPLPPSFPPAPPVLREVARPADPVFFRKDSPVPLSLGPKASVLT